MPSFLILRVRVHVVGHSSHNLIHSPQGHTLLDRVEGADAASLTSTLARHVIPATTVTPQSQTTKAPGPPPATIPDQEVSEDENERLLKLMNQSKVVLFMKGSPDEPRCGFSKRIVALLRDQGVEFTHFDILLDQNARQGQYSEVRAMMHLTDSHPRAGLKVINNWPTFPQLIIGGEFVGGLDIVTEMANNGELKELLA